jgi:hypothetical protein
VDKFTRMFFHQSRTHACINQFQKIELNKIPFENITKDESVMEFHFSFLPNNIFIFLSISHSYVFPLSQIETRHTSIFIRTPTYRHMLNTIFPFWFHYFYFHTFFLCFLALLVVIVIAVRDKCHRFIRHRRLVNVRLATEKKNSFFSWTSE